jgi:hypothetical protein
MFESIVETNSEKNRISAPISVSAPLDVTNGQNATSLSGCGSVRVLLVGATVARVELKILLNPGRLVRSFVRSLPRKGAFSLINSSGGGEGS